MQYENNAAERLAGDVRDKGMTAPLIPASHDLNHERKPNPGRKPKLKLKLKPERKPALQGRRAGRRFFGLGRTAFSSASSASCWSRTFASLAISSKSS